MLDVMQTRAELYGTTGYSDYEALDRNIVRTIVPTGIPQDLPSWRSGRGEKLVGEEGLEPSKS